MAFKSVTILNSNVKNLKCFKKLNFSHDLKKNIFFATEALIRSYVDLEALCHEPFECSMLHETTKTSQPDF